MAAAPDFCEREGALLQLMGDPAFSRMEERDLPTLVDACLARGQVLAGGWVGREPVGALASLGYEVRRTSGPAPGSRPGFCLCAMTRALPCGEKGGTVELYVGEVARKRAALLASGVEVGEEELERLHLAHELYHALEFSDGPLTVDAVPRVRVRGLLSARPRAVARSSELAAHAFARRVTSSALLPSWIDATFLLAEGSLERQTLLDELALARKILGT